MTGVTGAIAGLATPVVSVGAAADEGTSGATDEDIEERVTTLLTEHRYAQAAELLSEHGVEFSHNNISMPSVYGGNTSDSGFSIQSEFDKGPSWFHHFAFHDYGNVYRSHAGWGLEHDSGGDKNVDSPGPKDGIGLTVSNALWEPVLNSWEFGDHTSLRKRDRYGRGIIGGFNDPGSGAWSERCQSWQHLNFRKVDSGIHNIYGTYIHSWNKFSLPGGITYGFGWGPITASVGTTTDYWRKRSDVDV